MIPLVDLKRQYLSIKEEIDGAIQRVLDSSSFILGEEVKKFEEEFAKFCGAKYCIGVSSGTAALHLALDVVGIGKNDEIITVPNSFIATTNVICYVGGKIKFVDVNPKTYTIDVSRLKQSISKKTKAIIPVHLYGYPCDMDEIMDIAKEYKLKVIEDCAQAHNAKFENTYVGNFGDVGCFSFYPAKNLGAYGDAGAVITNNEEIYEKVRMLRDCGRKEKYKHELIGYNYRVDSIQAAILRVKLKYLEEWTEKRRKNAKLYKKLLSNIITPVEDEKHKHVYHLYVVNTNKRDALQTYLKKEGIETGIHYPIPLHLQPAYKSLEYKEGNFPITEKLAKEILSLPMFPELTEKEINEVCEKINYFCK